MKHGKMLDYFRSLPSLVIAASALAGFAGFTTSAIAQPETLEIDPAHSTVGFKIKHLFSFVNGRFGTVEGNIVVDSEKPDNASVKVSIGAKSIDTGVAKRDEHLRSADFFDVEKYPSLSFVSKSVKLTGENTAEMVGDLTLHGVTKEVPLKVTFLGKGPGPQGEIRTGWQATGALKRSDFGMAWGKVIEGTPLVGDLVEITLDVEAIKK